MMLFVEYSKCSTCQKAKKWLLAVTEDRVLVGFKGAQWAEVLSR